MMNHDETLPEQLKSAVATLRAGGVVCFPTETYYGLAVDSQSEAAVGALLELKKRDQKPIPLIAASMAQAQSQVHLPDSAWRQLSGFWPGPLTVVAAAKAPCPQGLLAGGSTLGIRISSHPIAQGLAAALGRPITSTSANLPGEAPASSVEFLSTEVVHGVDCIIDAGVTPGGPASTVVAFEGDALRMIRMGAVSAMALEHAGFVCR